MALVSEDRVLHTGSVPAKSALEQGLAAVDRALTAAQLTPAGLDRLAVGIGPGSFTGVRIAVSFAKSLALAWGLPLVGVNTFDAIEAGLELEEPRLTVVRGRTGVVSVRACRAGQPWRASGYVRDVLDAFGTGPGELQVAGDAEDVLAGLAERGWNVHVIEQSAQPQALAVAMAAAPRAPAQSVHELRADYGELPAVNPK